MESYVDMRISTGSKKGDRIVWKLQFFCLDNGCITFFDSQDKHKSTGVFPVDATTTVTTTSSSSALDEHLPLEIILKNSDHTLLQFMLYSSELRDMWSEAVVKHIALIKRASKNKRITLQVGGFSHSPSIIHTTSTSATMPSSIEGYVTIKGPWPFLRWKVRWLSFSSCLSSTSTMEDDCARQVGVLRYYKNRSKAKLKGSLVLQSREAVVSKEPLDKGMNKHIIRVDSGGSSGRTKQQLLFSCDSFETREAWLGGIAAAAIEDTRIGSTAHRLISTDKLAHTVQDDDAVVYPVLNDKEDDAVPVLSDKDDDAVPASTDQEDKAVPASTDKDDDAVPASTDKDDDAVPASTDQEDEAVPVLSDKEDEAVAASTEKDDEDVPASADKDDEAVPASTDQEDDAVAASTEKDDDAVPASTDQEDKAVPVLSEKEDDAVAASTDKGDEAVPASTDKDDDAVAEAEVEVQSEAEEIDENDATEDEASVDLLKATAAAEAEESRVLKQQRQQDAAAAKEMIHRYSIHEEVVAEIQLLQKKLREDAASFDHHHHHDHHQHHDHHHHQQHHDHHHQQQQQQQHAMTLLQSGSTADPQAVDSHSDGTGRAPSEYSILRSFSSAADGDGGWAGDGDGGCVHHHHQPQQLHQHQPSSHDRPPQQEVDGATAATASPAAAAVVAMDLPTTPLGSVRLQKLKIEEQQRLQRMKTIEVGRLKKKLDSDHNDNNDAL